MKLNPLFLLLAGALATAPAFAGPTVIGVATAVGSFSVNNTSVSGTANLPDGALVKTTVSTGELTLKGGSSVVLATHSAANVYEGKVVLVSGMAKFDNMKPGFKVNASSLLVENDRAGGQGAVRLNGDKVEVASVAGNMNVYNHQGTLLARVAAGSVVAVEDQSGATAGQDQNSNKKDCTGSHKNDPGCGAAVPSGAGGGAAAPIMSNGAALWIAAGLAAVGVGLGVGLTQSSSSSSP